MSQAQPAEMSGVLMASGMRAGSGVSGRCGWRKTSGSWELLGGGRPALLGQESDFLAKQGRSQRGGFGKETNHISIYNGVAGSWLRAPQCEVGGCLPSGGCRHLFLPFAS